MKKLIGNLKENPNNILLYAIFFSAGIHLIVGLEYVISDLYYCFSGEDGYLLSEELPYILEYALTAVAVLASLISAVLAKRRNKKFMLVTVFILAALTAYNMSAGFLNCMIIAIVWYRNDADVRQIELNKLLKLAFILAAITLVSVLILPLYGSVLALLSHVTVDGGWIMAVYGMQWGSFLIKPEIILMIYLFVKSKCLKKIRKTTIVYFVLWILIAVSMIAANVTGTYLAAGSWEDWSTEDGSAATYETFEFE